MTLIEKMAVDSNVSPEVIYSGFQSIISRPPTDLKRTELEWFQRIVGEHAAALFKRKGEEKK